MTTDGRAAGNEGRESGVDARHGRGMQFGDHNVQINTFGPVVRSAYLEQVRRIAPARLRDREAELAALADFCAGDGPHPYLCWQATTGAGKTALLSWFVLHPPPGVRLVSFFGDAHDGRRLTDAYTDVVLEQLVELTDGAMPAHLTRATRHAHLLGRYAGAAAACRRRGERLVLVVDGLDAGGAAKAPSVAALLPARPVDGLRVVTATDGNRSIPADVPTGHPLRERAARPLLSPYVSPEERARRERKREDARRWAEEKARRTEQEEHDRRLRTELDAARTSPRARAEAAGRALALTAGWTLALILAVWLTWGWFDAGVAGILTVLLLLAGAGAGVGLVPSAVELGGAYHPDLRSPAAWLPGARAGLIGGVQTLVLWVVGGATALDYLDARRGRLTLQDITGEGGVGFTEVVALGFLVLAGVGCFVVGLLAAVRAVPGQRGR
ncbi:hypothetical protein ABT023_22760 [Micromonospora sp. NPDC002296]|uniref:hypothetical protein n=1 Tax=Micromonospora sp. NPDC002296 TaxID=3154271 RepID=UPI0033331CD3